MKLLGKRVLSAFLALVIVVMLMPLSAVETEAVSEMSLVQL